MFATCRGSKGGYTASLQYAVARPDFGWVFALSLTWDLEPLYPCGSNSR